MKKETIKWGLGFLIFGTILTIPGFKIINKEWIFTGQESIIGLMLLGFFVMGCSLSILGTVLTINGLIINNHPKDEVRE
jgi:hypothetical protein